MDSVFLDTSALVAFFDRKDSHHAAASNAIRLVWLDEPLKRAAWDYFKRHADKTCSFTDCTSFILMKEMKLTKYLSFDEHFKQAGFMPF